MSFHLKHGWYFERLNGGKSGAGVRIYHAPFDTPERDVSMSVDDWISVVTEMAGGSAEAHSSIQQVLREYMGSSTPDGERGA